MELTRFLGIILVGSTAPWLVGLWGEGTPMGAAGTAPTIAAAGTPTLGFGWLNKDHLGESKFLRSMTWEMIKDILRAQPPCEGKKQSKNFRRTLSIVHILNSGG